MGDDGMIGDNIVQLWKRRSRLDDAELELCADMLPLIDVKIHYSTPNNLRYRSW